MSRSRSECAKKEGKCEETGCKSDGCRKCRACHIFLCFACYGGHHCPQLKYSSPEELQPIKRVRFNGEDDDTADIDDQNQSNGILSPKRSTTSDKTGSKESRIKRARRSSQDLSPSSPLVPAPNGSNTAASIKNQIDEDGKANQQSAPPSSMSTPQVDRVLVVLPVNESLPTAVDYAPHHEQQTKHGDIDQLLADEAGDVTVNGNKSDDGEVEQKAVDVNQQQRGDQQEKHIDDSSSKEHSEDISSVAQNDLNPQVPACVEGTAEQHHQQESPPLTLGNDELDGFHPAEVILEGEASLRPAQDMVITKKDDVGVVLPSLLPQSSRNESNGEQVAKVDDDQEPADIDPATGLNIAGLKAHRKIESLALQNIIDCLTDKFDKFTPRAREKLQIAQADHQDRSKALTALIVAKSKVEATGTTTATTDEFQLQKIAKASLDSPRVKLSELVTIHVPDENNEEPRNISPVEQAASDGVQEVNHQQEEGLATAQEAANTSDIILKSVYEEGDSLECTELDSSGLAAALPLSCSAVYFRAYHLKSDSHLRPGTNYKKSKFVFFGCVEITSEDEEDEVDDGCEEHQHGEDDDSSSCCKTDHEELPGRRVEHPICYCFIYVSKNDIAKYLSLSEVDKQCYKMAFVYSDKLEIVEGFMENLWDDNLSDALAQPIAESMARWMKSSSEEDEEALSRELANAKDTSPQPSINGKELKPAESKGDSGKSNTPLREAAASNKNKVTPPSASSSKPPLETPLQVKTRSGNKLQPSASQQVVRDNDEGGGRCAAASKGVSKQQQQPPKSTTRKKAQPTQQRQSPAVTTTMNTRRSGGGHADEETSNNTMRDIYSTLKQLLAKKRDDEDVEDEEEPSSTSKKSRTKKSNAGGVSSSAEQLTLPASLIGANHPTLLQLNASTDSSTANPVFVLVNPYSASAGAAAIGQLVQLNGSVQQYSSLLPNINQQPAAPQPMSFKEMMEDLASKNDMIAKNNLANINASIDLVRANRLLAEEQHASALKKLTHDRQTGAYDQETNLTLKGRDNDYMRNQAELNAQSEAKIKKIRQPSPPPKPPVEEEVGKGFKSSFF